MALFSFVLSLCFFSTALCQKFLNLSSTEWHLSNSNRTIDMITAVPGGVYSSLEDAVMIGDILYGNHDVDYRWIAMEDWNYFRNFQISTEDLQYDSIRLVLHGVDTIGDIFINDHAAIHCNNMFVRYSADVKPFLSVGTNNITVQLRSPVREAKKLAIQIGYPVPPQCPPATYNGECHVNMLRKMQASFSWDWGPAFPSLGIWKKPEIVFSNGPQIGSVVSRIVAEDNDWKVKLTVWFEPSETSFKDLIYVEFTWLDGNTSIFKFDLEINNVNKQKKDLSFSLPQEKIDLWWPKGYGGQTLYKVRVYYKYSEKTIIIGFRTITLIQSQLTENINDGTLFYFLVNGKKIFAKGSNWIPSHVLPERLSDELRVIPLLEASVDANFNMMRVWGGGVYESDMFYETADRLGIMIWHDLMFACSMYPVSNEYLDNVKLEVEQQIQRLQHHPSIAVWAGNNENEAALMQNWYGTNSNFDLYKQDYLKLYVETIKPVVLNIDDTRTYLTSSPSNDIGDISSKPSDTLHGDVHYYNYLNNGWNYNIYPKPRFASEYGMQSLPSYYCLRAALPLNETKWGGDYFNHRQHSPAGNEFMMGLISKNLPTSNDIKDLIYLSQINQAMAMKVESESYRRLKSILLDSNEGYTMGALYWQLNDIWQAPSWSSIDYCGNWKMLHYFVKEFFAPIIVSPEISIDKMSVSLYIVVDGDSEEKNAILTFNIYEWTKKDWLPSKKITKEVTMKDNESYLALVVPVHQYCSDKNCFFTTELTNNGKEIAPENFLFYKQLKKDNYPNTVVQVTKIELVDNFTARITLQASHFALYVWLEINETKGTFSKNGFHMFNPSTEVIFKSKDQIYFESLTHLSVTWLKKNYTDDNKIF